MVFLTLDVIGQVLQIDSMLLCVWSVTSQMMSKGGKNIKVAHEVQPSVSLMFLPHFDICDVLMNRHMATWNISVLYNKEKSCL